MSLIFVGEKTRRRTPNKVMINIEKFYILVYRLLSSRLLTVFYKGFVRSPSVYEGPPPDRRPSVPRAPALSARVDTPLAGDLHTPRGRTGTCRKDSAGVVKFGEISGLSDRGRCVVGRDR